jgi:hypothetical protein
LHHPFYEVINTSLTLNPRLLKHPEVEPFNFVEVLTFIEKSVTVNLLPHGSIGKFIFMDSRGKWFVCLRNKDKISISYLQHGPWTHFEEVFKSPDNIYESKDILYPGSNKKYMSVITNFSKDILSMAGETDFTLADYTGNKYIWNLHAVPFVLSDDKLAKAEVKKIFNEENCTIFTNAEECVVRKGIFISISQSGNTKDHVELPQEKIIAKKTLSKSK